MQPQIGTSTLYDGTGAPLPPPPTGPLVVILGSNFTAAGLNDENDGLYGRIDLGATAPML